MGKELELTAIFGLAITLALTFLLSLPFVIKAIKTSFRKTKFANLGNSTKIRVIHEITNAVMELSSKDKKIGAIITISNKESLDLHRTDGVKINANVSAYLIISLFQKNSPLHDGAIVIEGDKIKYAGTYFKISNQSLDSKMNYGARHRAALGISEQTDALAIVTSETNGKISFAKNGKIFFINRKDFQTKLLEQLN